MPCQAVLSPRAPSGPGWLHEVKHDGYRLIARKDGQQVRLWTRQAVDYTTAFPWITAALAGLPVASCTLDGESVCFGKSNYSFNALRTREGARDAHMIAFDIMELAADDLRDRPIEERRAMLRGLLASGPPGGIIFSAGLEGDGPTIFEEACGLGLEGIVSKRLGSKYRSGRCPDWRKTKNPAYVRQER